MRKSIIVAATLGAILAAPSLAQYRERDRDRGAMRGPPRAILYGKPGFQGRSLVVDRPIGRLEKFGFDDRPSSIMIRGGGAWKICEDDHFGGRCEIIDRPIADLVVIRMNNKVSSIAPVGPGPGGPPPRRY